MTAKSDRKPKARHTTMVPVTTMEELPVLNESERAELLDSLKKAQAEIESGNYKTFEPEAFKKRLLGIYRNKKR